MSDYRIVTAETLSEAFRKYIRNFGVEPHGTEKQCVALLEFCHPVITPKELWENSGILPDDMPLDVVHKIVDYLTQPKRGS